MNAEDAKGVLWSSQRRAMFVLMWAHIAYMPVDCPKCNSRDYWDIVTPETSFAHAFCSRPLDDDAEDEVGSDSPPRRSRCSKRVTWRKDKKFLAMIPNNTRPAELLKAMYWFLQDCTMKTAVKETFRQLSWSSRQIMFDNHLAQDCTVKLGGPGRVVCIDETHFTSRRRNRGGFQGRWTRGHQTIILGMVELDLATRTETGRVRLIVIDNKKKVTLKGHIDANVSEGSLIFTDSFASYSFLSRRGSKFVHRVINHKRGEFSRMEELFGVQVNVTTNAAEGLFGRVKIFCRQKQIRRVSKNAYGLIMSEFLWRRRVLNQQSEWKDAGLWKLMELIGEWENVVQADLMEVPADVVQEIVAFRESTRVIPPPPPAVVAVAPALPPPVFAASPALRRCVRPRRLPSPPAAAAAGVPAQRCQRPQRPQPAAATAEVKTEPKRELHSPAGSAASPDSSDVELVSMSVNPATARVVADLQQVKQEPCDAGPPTPADPSGAAAPEAAPPSPPAEQAAPAVLPLREAAKVSFCPQGHGLRFYYCDPLWQAGRSGGPMWATFYECDHCGAKQLKEAYSCETCEFDVCGICYACF